MNGWEAVSQGDGPRSAFRRLLINDEGNACLHHLDLLAPQNDWKHPGAGRDLQLVGGGRVLRSRPGGYVEVHLRTGATVREVAIPHLPGGVESARRLRDGDTVVAGNSPSGAFLWQVDPQGLPRPGRTLAFAGIEKVRLARLTGAGTFLFCSDREGARLIHEADWRAGIRTVYEVPGDVPADSMVKAVWTAPGFVVVSTGYAASLLGVDVSARRVAWTIGGKTPDDRAPTKRPLSPFFFSGFQSFANGDHLIGNWQGHSAGMNGQGYQLLRYDAAGRLLSAFDQSAYPALSSLNNVIVLDGLDTDKLHDEPDGVLVPVT